MRKNGRNNIGKERLIMIASSAFVMAALTMTGVYVKEQKQEKNDGYTLDFNSLENDLSDKVEEIGQSRKEQGRTEASDVSESTGRKLAANPVTEDDLDYDPLSEVGSSLVEIPGLTDQKAIKMRKPRRNCKRPSKRIRRAKRKIWQRQSPKPDKRQPL